MSQLQGELTRTQFKQLWLKLEASVQAVFRSDGFGTRSWRQLLAFNPSDTFTLENYSQIDLFQKFLRGNDSKLCAGYLSYDLGLKQHNIQSQFMTDQPLAIFHAYDNWLEIEGELVQVYSPDQSFFEELIQLVELAPDKPTKHQPLQFTPSVLQSDYKNNITKIQDYIRAGDFYQINYTQQLHSETNQDPRQLYADLLEQHPAEYACYLEVNGQSIHSLSPELFLNFDGGKLTTKPIKGTRPRGITKTEDEKAKETLLASDKEQAELYMITDLLRNDLGQVCEIGSVHLDAVKSLNKLPKVWHTYSQISGIIKPDLSPLDALLTMFPGGSITGCPKKRALEVIDELEISSRGIYTGSIGYVHPSGDFSFNIAIRTMVQAGSGISLGSGGGITIDSNWQDEWQELLVKVSTFE